MSSIALLANQENILVEESSNCFLCGGEGIQFYRSLRDRLFSAPGQWNLLRCPECELAWVCPRPLASEIGKLYTNYYTHQHENSGWRSRLRDELLFAAVGAAGQRKFSLSKVLGGILHLFPTTRVAARTATLRLGTVPKGRLLDVGCGNGRLLKLMQGAGWQVQGVEPDPASAGIASEALKVPVHISQVESMHPGNNCFDIVTLNHVFEHLSDPLAGLAACWRSLSEGGRIIILTPNFKSLGHRIFREDCISLDAPRHLFLYSPGALRSLIEKAGFVVESLETPTRLAGQTWITSRQLRKRNFRRTGSPSFVEYLLGMMFSLFEKVLHLFVGGIGEEILVIARKSRTSQGIVDQAN